MGALGRQDLFEHDKCWVPGFPQFLRAQGHVTDDLLRSGLRPVFLGNALVSVECLTKVLLTPETRVDDATDEDVRRLRTHPTNNHVQPVVLMVNRIYYMWMMI